jgi:hypothetical protein
MHKRVQCAGCHEKILVDIFDDIKNILKYLSQFSEHLWTQYCNSFLLYTRENDF